MRSKKTIITVILSVLILSLLTIFLFIDEQETEQTNTLTKSASEEKAETDTINPTNEAQGIEIEEPQSESEPESEHPIAEEIKKTVKQVVEGAIGLFLRNDLKIVAIGDSLTQGVGDETNNGGYVGILSNTFSDNNEHVNIENYGKRGNRSDQLLERLEQTEIKASIEEADIVLITIGANDIMKVVKNNFTNLNREPFELERAEYEERLRQIFDKILAINPDTEIHLIGFYNPFERYFSDIEQLGVILDNWNATGQQVVAEYEQIHFIPTIDLFRTSNKELLADDNFHPNVEGYKLMAKRVLEYIRPSIEKTENDNPESVE